MKTVKKIVAAVLVSAMALSLAACGGSKAKKISAEDFKSKLEGEGYTVMDSEATEESAKSSMIAFNSEQTVMISYNLYESNDAAKNYFNDMKDGAEEAKKSGEIEKLSTSSSKLTAESADSYIVIVYAEDMVIMATSLEGGEDGKKAVDACIKTLGV